MGVLSPPFAASCFKIRRFKAVGLDANVGPLGGGARSQESWLRALCHSAALTT